MTRRILVSYLTITVLVLVLLMVPLGIFYSQRERERTASDAEHDANVIATLYEDDLEAGVPLDPTAAINYQDRTDARVVVVDIDGISQVDTGGVIDRDFSTRPEIAAALDGIRTSGTRRSDTLGTDLLFVAVPVASGGTVHGALRLTLDTGDVSRRILYFWLALGGVAVVVLWAVALIGWVIARSVTRPIRELTASAGRFAGGDLSVGPEMSEGPRLDTVLTTQRSFVADASHQLRTPLTALRLRLENLQSDLDGGGDRPADPASAAALELAIDETVRLTELVTSLLQLARADEHPETVVTDLAALVRDRIDTWTAVAEDRSVVIDGAPGSEPVLVRCVPGAIEQILDNLLDNALGVSPTGSSVGVVVTDRDGVGEVCVVDHGPGLSDPLKTDALRRFWRGDTTRPGTGLGLAIVETLAVVSGGRVVLLDTPGGGLTVSVELPLAHSIG